MVSWGHNELNKMAAILHTFSLKKMFDFWIFFFIIEMHSHRQILSHHWYRKVLTKTTNLHTNEHDEGRTFGAFCEFNSLWPSDAIWHHRSKSTLVQVMACCLTAPSHHAPKPMLTNHQWGLVAFTWGKFHRKCPRYVSLLWVWKISQGLMS